MHTRFLLVAAIGALLAGCERSQNSYASWPDAERAGAVRRGWLPPWVPRSAMQIDEAHDLDTNLLRLRFKLPPAELAALSGSLQRLRVRDLCKSAGLPKLPGEWPSSIDEGAPAWNLSYLRAAGANGAGLAVAVERETSTVYVWSCPDLR